MKDLKEILKNVRDNQISIKKAERLLKINYLDRVDNFAQLDIFRKSRTGIPEVVYAESKEINTIKKIVESLLKRNHYALLTRLKDKDFNTLVELYSTNQDFKIIRKKLGRSLFICKSNYQIEKQAGTVGIITAGTSDVPIAEEITLVLNVMGFNSLNSYDAGIAGIHRIFPPLKQMIEENVDVIIVLAGMEGTLPGVVSALVDIPVIGVPISTGYGVGEKGKAALNTMLQSCSPGLSVVNIDNSFGAASMAALILKRINEN